MSKYYILLTIILFYIGSFAEASKQSFIQYNFNYLTEDNGLPHNFVNDIHKDSEGYIWLATQNGISRYDGYNFTNYNSATTPINLK